MTTKLDRSIHPKVHIWSINSTIWQQWFHPQPSQNGMVPMLCTLYTKCLYLPSITAILLNIGPRSGISLLRKTWVILTLPNFVPYTYWRLEGWFGLQGIFRCTKDTNNSLTIKKAVVKVAVPRTWPAKKCVPFKLICLMCYIAIKLDLDETACFDLIIKACQNLLCLSHRADPQGIKLQCRHINTLNTTPKHSHRVSDRYNQHLPTRPWYGAGQGRDDAAVQWTIVSHSLITAYQSEATPWILKSAICNILFSLSLDAFVNDTSLIHRADIHTWLTAYSGKFKRTSTFGTAYSKQVEAY